MHTCIGEQLVNVLNDKGRLGRIYKGLVQHILAKPTTLGCEHVSVTLRLVSMDCLSPQPHFFQNDVTYNNKNWLANQRSTFFNKKYYIYLKYLSPHDP